jgi:hypothetical protein
MSATYYVVAKNLTCMDNYAGDSNQQQVVTAKDEGVAMGWRFTKHFGLALKFATLAEAVEVRDHLGGREKGWKALTIRASA